MPIQHRQPDSLSPFIWTYLKPCLFLCHAQVQDGGKSAVELLARELPVLVGSISFKKSMRWSSSVAYSRPLRWLLALHGDTPVPFAYAGLVSGSSTR